MSWIKAEKLRFSYDQNEIIRPLSFEFERKGLAFLSGPSGIGKSTLAQLLCGHLLPSSGFVYIDDQLVRAPGRHSYLVSQEEDLFPWSTAERQFNYFSERPGSLKNWRPLTKILEVEKYLSLFPAQMSVGTKKRISLLRASILRPSLLVLDETLSSIEPALRGKILTEFLPIWRELGVGVILISHDPFPLLRNECVGEITL